MGGKIHTTRKDFFMKTTKFNFNIMFLLFALIPMVSSILVLAVYNVSNLDSKLEENTYSKLKSNAIQVREYFEWDINEDILERDEVSMGFIDSLKDQEIELTLFEKDTRWLTSICNDNGERNIGTTCDPEIWSTVSSGKDYSTDQVVISGEEYFVYYTPVYDKSGHVWGMAFAGEKEEFIDQAKRNALWATVGCSAGLVALFAVIALVFARKVSKPLVMVTEAVKETAAGNLNTDTGIHSITSETVQLITAAKTLQDVLKQTIGKTLEISRQVSSGAEDVSALSSTSAEGSEQIANAMHDLANGAVSMAENVQNINEQVISIGKVITDIEENIGTLVNASNTIRLANEEAGDYMVRVSDSSERSADAVAGINQKIRETNQAIEKINEAVGIIISIASQTNLLSLNASIEAARAGEAGKGFAVVAGEIQNLSDQSNHSAAEIQTIVRDIITKSKESVELSESVTETVKEERKYIEETREKFEMLGKEITFSLQKIQSISGLTKELGKARDMIDSSVSDLSAISEENAASNQEVTASITGVAESIHQIAENSENTRKYAEELKDTIMYFDEQ